MVALQSEFFGIPFFWQGELTLAKQGDAGSTSFRALIYIPSAMPNDFYSKTYVELEAIKLLVRRVFITSDLGKDYIPKYLNWHVLFLPFVDGHR